MDRRRIAVLLLAVLPPSASFGATYYVASGGDNSDGLTWATAWTNAQSAIQSGGAGHTYHVGAGTWQMTNTALLVPNGTTLIGTNRDSVVFVAAPSNRVITCGDSNCVVSSMTIRNGYTNSRAGLFIPYGGTGYVTNCLVVSNAATVARGGYGDASAYNSSFVSNVNGGAFVLNGAAVSCVAERNTGYGFDLYSLASTGMHLVARFNAGAGIKNGTTFASYAAYNTNSGGAGGGFVGGSHRNATSEYNSARYGGGGYNAVFSNSVVVFNVASSEGGGVSGNDTYVYRSLIASNRAPKGGGSSAAYRGVFDTVYDGNAAAEAPASLGDSLYGCTIVNHTNRSAAVDPYNGYRRIVNNLLFNNASNIILPNTTNVVANNVTNIDPDFVEGTYVPRAAGVVDSANETYVVTALDYYGSNRTAGAGTDVGAAENQSPPAPADAARKRRFFALF